MSALEQEIIEKFRLLDAVSKRRVLSQIEHETATGGIVAAPVSLQAWLAWATGFGEYVERKYGRRSISSVELLDAAREERLNDLMGSS